MTTTISVGDYCSNMLSVTAVFSTAIDNLAITLQLTGRCSIINDRPFRKFSLDTLLSELNFTHIFQNRKAFHFDMSTFIDTRLYIKLIPENFCSYMEVLLPNYQFNSVLVKFYKTVNCFRPLHSD